MAYLQQAAENGHPKARLDLGMAYRDGVGVAPDPVQAAFWLVLASEAWSPAARFMTAGARRKLGPEQVADLEQRLATFRRDHPTAPPAGDARAAAP